ncbi:BTAD domain-containing putative transcriptional regulator [Blastococcus sp. BMG 814]|uniref:BTAD domain-containing putative transcriptional regulator n=1 Tax=Blastococcus carthaginiensis TaxID=3050034 RepID=A0ABT9I7Q6_9ACTN|nr:BTAD domain-containing putative transcriptional regulator [Blastococcus carthaginiensis]MDP5181592.1 BTAD domain-containing putative transcriptional regulator [Blastococcus carthaginiensis]
MDRSSGSRVTLLDGFGLRLSGVARPSAGDDLPRAVQRLVALVCLSHRPTRTATAGRLWPDVPEDHAHGSLRSALWRLNKAAPGLVEVSGGALRLGTDVRVDVSEMSDWALGAIGASVRSDRAVRASTDLPDTDLLGDLLPGWYDDWVLLERERLRQLRMQALEAVAARLLSLGRHGEALEAAHAAVGAEPLRESARRILVRIHLAEGNLAEAVRAYELFRTLLEDELGVPPTEQMTRLVQHIPQVRRGLAVRSRPRPDQLVPRPGATAAAPARRRATAGLPGGH